MFLILQLLFQCLSTQSVVDGCTLERDGKPGYQLCAITQCGGTEPLTLEAQSRSDVILSTRPPFEATNQGKVSQAGF